MTFHDSDALFRAIERRDSHMAPLGGKRLKTVTGFNNKALVVATSLIPDAGLGVFSGQESLRRGGIVTQYAGWSVPKGLLTRSCYSIQCSELRVIGDPASQDPAKGVGALVNDVASVTTHHLHSLEDAVLAYERASARANVKCSVQDGVVVLLATCDIEPHTELVLSYGLGFWLEKLAARVLFTHDIKRYRQVINAASKHGVLDQSKCAHNSMALPNITETQGHLVNINNDSPATSSDCKQVLAALGRLSMNPQMSLVALLRGAIVRVEDDMQ